jgi:uncharacterized membrane protein
MKKLILLFALLFSVSSSFISCRDEPDRGDRVEEATDELEERGDEIEDEYDDMEDEL